MRSYLSQIDDVSRHQSEVFQGYFVKKHAALANVARQPQIVCVGGAVRVRNRWRRVQKTG